MDISITKLCSLPARAIFKAITKSLVDDYVQNTKESLKEEDLRPGLSYIKYFGNKNQSSSKVTLTALDSPNLYEVVFSTNRGKQTISYQLESISDTETQICYSQKVEQGTFAQKTNDFIAGLFFKKGLERKIEAQLTALVNYVQQQTFN
ncbi:hypothetical protein BN1356_01395 [Streptococcus varani]|uniref:DUF3284 domain-containing protein n=1 Tax=Streptococcus varani TaxID=1608583 RepID=A0A0E4H554_9STRE|nr:DUF3284 domain-containing protein [Streptococcus varani]CQR25052.1 hypothetical protein BN1356_01395 [Streptococcus varani]